MFWDSIGPIFKCQALPLKNVPIVWPEKLVQNYHSTLCKGNKDLNISDFNLYVNMYITEAFVKSVSDIRAILWLTWRQKTSWILCLLVWFSATVLWYVRSNSSVQLSVKHYKQTLHNQQVKRQRVPPVKPRLCTDINYSNTLPYWGLTFKYIIRHKRFSHCP